jgi:hypothetical protein
MLVAAAVGLLAGAAHTHSSWTSRLDADERGLVGFAGHIPDSTKPKLTAFFPQESYAPDSTATLHIWDRAKRLRLRIFRAGTIDREILPSDVMTGSPVSGVTTLPSVHGDTAVPVHIGSWPSGLYYARLTAGNRIGYATFVLRPAHLGTHDVAIVLPTQTWQAYNFRDDNGDGVPDTWYAHGSRARLQRPFLNRGVPPHYKHYDARFLAWAYTTHHEADYLSDAELNAADGTQLRRAYRLLIFEGHHEYVTEHEYDAVERYRDLGGNLAFLSANNFFWKITIEHGVMTRVAQWRDLGRPEASLIGVQYYENDRGGHRGAWVVRPAAKREPWLFSGTGLRAGDGLASGGIEADDVVPASPHNVQVVASISNLYGDGRDADMTYYRAGSGAQIFAAGAFSLADWVSSKPVRRLIANIWSEFTTGD